MILYLSGASDYKIYNEQFEKGLMAGGYQAQKFNINIIKGLSKLTDVTALSSLYYGNFDVPERDEVHDGVRYICIRNYTGFKHKLLHAKELIKKGSRVIKEGKTDYIICDAISLCHAAAALYLSKKYNIPAVGIITDVPEVYCSGRMSIWGRITSFLMKRFSSYVLLTESMNNMINPKNRPFIIMEGSCELEQINDIVVSEKSAPKVCLYGGSLWKENAGLEYFIEGFIKADIPNCELHFYGTGALSEEIEQLSLKHPNVKYMGCVKNAELVELQRKATLLINPRPSNEEFCKYSFPSKTFEYMASGTPVLMTRLPGIPNEYFNYVYIIEKETPDGVCEALKDIFLKSSEELEQKAAAARNFIMNNKNNYIQAEKIWNFLGSEE